MVSLCSCIYLSGKGHNFLWHTCMVLHTQRCSILDWTQSHYVLTAKYVLRVQFCFHNLDSKTNLCFCCTNIWTLHQMHHNIHVFHFAWRHQLYKQGTFSSNCQQVDYCLCFCNSMNVLHNLVTRIKILRLCCFMKLDILLIQL